MLKSPPIQVENMLTHNKPASRPQLGKQIKAQFGDGRWHSFETIVAATGAPAEKVWSVFDHMWRSGTYKTKCDPQESRCRVPLPPIA